MLKVIGSPAGKKKKGNGKIKSHIELKDKINAGTGKNEKVAVETDIEEKKDDESS